ncbi:hypothetical protein DFH06DRAFT_1483712 [Mycena polygramma]|nr:hypothetical protein DFH06DRAFT_1483712 [Mycena polygramma]
MAHLATALLGSLWRVSSQSPAALSHSRSDPDLAVHIDMHLRPASLTGVRSRPASAIEGYWGWGWDAGLEGTTPAGLKAPADVRVTHSSDSPVHASTGQPPPAQLPIADADASMPESGNAPNATAPAVHAFTVDRLDNSEPDLSFDIALAASQDISLMSNTSAPFTHDSEGDTSFLITLPPTHRLDPCADFEPDSSFDSSFDISLDISLISDTSTSSASDEFCDISFGSFHFALPPPILPPPSHPPSTSPAPPLSNTAPGAAPKAIGLGITNLLKPCRVPFDGTGVISFGVCGASSSAAPCRTRNEGASPDRLSRTFLEQLEAAWEKDPEHHYLGVINEAEDHGQN